MLDTNREANSPAARRFAAGMLAILLLSFGYLLYGASFEYGYAGFGALVAIPFSVGALVTQSAQRQYSVLGCIAAPITLFSVLFPFVYFGLAEGLVCIVMVLPLWFVAGLGGGIFMWLNSLGREIRDHGDQASKLKSVGWAALPLAMIFAEQINPPQWQVRTVSREVTISASAEELWPLLLNIPQIQQGEGKHTFTHDWLGIARPTDAELILRDGQLIRKARWGEDIRFAEHLTKLVQGEAIEWHFLFPDDSVQAYTDKHISPDGPILKIDRGGYRVEKLGSGVTRLTLWTTYYMRSRLDWYLEIWGELLLGDVERNVLSIIEMRAEQL